VSEDGLQSLLAVARLSHDGDVAFDLEQRGEGAEYHALILGEDYANGLRPSLSLSFETGDAGFNRHSLRFSERLP